MELQLKPIMRECKGDKYVNGSGPRKRIEKSKGKDSKGERKDCCNWVWKKRNVNSKN